MTDKKLYEIIHKYIPKDSETYQFYLPHVKAVAEKALEIGRRLNLTDEQLRFIEEGAMLHDIGIVGVDDPNIGCHGDEPYLRHGLIGAEFLRAEGLSSHADLIENHIGIGLTKKTIRDKNMPLPERDMIPTTVEQEIVAYADLFFSKSVEDLTKPRTTDEVREMVGKWGGDESEKLEKLIERFEE